MFLSCKIELFIVFLYRICDFSRGAHGLYYFQNGTI